MSSTYSSHRREMDRKNRRLRTVAWKRWKTHRKPTGTTGHVKIDPDDGSLWEWVSGTRQLTWVRPSPPAVSPEPPPKAGWCAHTMEVSPSGRFAECRTCRKLFKWRDGVWEVVEPATAPPA